MSDKKNINIPYKKLSTAYDDLRKIGKNHKKDRVNWTNINIDDANKTKEEFKIKKYEMVRAKMKPVIFSFRSLGVKFYIGEDDIDVNLNDSASTIIASGSFLGSGNRLRYFIPSKNEAIELLKKQKGISISKEPLHDDEDTVKKALGKCYLIYKNAKKYKEQTDNIYIAIQNLANEIMVEAGNISTISAAYKALEISAEAKFKGKKGKKYSKKQIAKKYAALVAAAGSKKAETYLKEILKETKSRVTQSNVLSIYEKYKKNGNKISGNLKFGKSSSPTKDSSTDNGSTSNNSNKKKKKTNTKTSTKKKVKAKVAALATTIASIKTERKNYIADVKANLATEVKNLELKKDKQIAEIKLGKNRDIENAYKDAEEKIKNIDPNSETAKFQIDEINNELNAKIQTINDEANMDIKQVTDNTAQQITDTTTAANNQIADAKDQYGQIIKEAKAAKKVSTLSDVAMTTSTLGKIGAKSISPTETATVELQAAQQNEAAASQGATAAKTSFDTTINTQKNAIENAQKVPEKVPTTPAEPVKEPTTTTPPTTNDSVAIPEETDQQPQQTNTNTNNNSNGTVSYTNRNTSSSNNLSSAPEVSQSTDAEATSTDVITEPSAETTPETNIDEVVEKTPNKNVVIDNNSDSKTTPSKSSGGSAVIPAILGVGAAGAAAVAGVRYVKNRKQTEDVDENYDDESNASEFEDTGDDSSYMQDDYLGPAGSEYTDPSNLESTTDDLVPDDNSYTDAGALEDELDDGDDDFENDEAFNEIN